LINWFPVALHEIRLLKLIYAAVIRTADL